MKAVAREGGEFHDIDSVERAITFPISNSMVYVGTAFHAKPHGQAPNNSLTTAIDSYQAHGVPVEVCDRMSGTIAQP